MYEEHEYTSLRVQPTSSIQVGMDLYFILFYFFQQHQDQRFVGEGVAMFTSGLL